ncbi:Ger(x)C family spore germination C-terminal domain-containing protein [Paenibacillus sepulcri]|uniref:Ger(X)C family spore germination C-terminal domain-containing protein n=1 Tax=Paenibacillus sepulcri TaxID=359917 RepID=A0ABS7C2L6_9BACL|nr:Ger(x)C family spore germination C-terminal domain-containing protein [Paenibacillus sepulcri]
MRTTNRTFIWILLVGCILISGCSPFVDNNTVEEIAPIIFWSIDGASGKKLKISTLVPPLLNMKKRMLTMQVDMLKQGEKNFNLNYYRELKLGQLRMLFLNENYVKHNGTKPLRTSLMNPDVSPRIFPVIVRGKFEEYLNNQLPEQDNLDYFLYRMFKHYEIQHQGEMTIVNLHDYLKRYYSPSPYPVLPVFKAVPSSFTYDGTALFHGDTLMGTIHNEEDEIFQLIDNDHYLKQLPIPKLSLSLGNIRAETSMKISRDYSALSLQVRLEAKLEEYQKENNLFEQDGLSALEVEIESYLNTSTLNLLNKMQRWKVDPLQVGTHTITPFKKPMSSERWEVYWEHMKMNVDYQVVVVLRPLTRVSK